MANKTVMDAFYTEKRRLAAACGTFIAYKEPVECFNMMLQQVTALRAEFNALMMCLNSPSRRVDDEAYFKMLIAAMQEQINALMVGWPEIRIDETGRVHGKPSGLLKMR